MREHSTALDDIETQPGVNAHGKEENSRTATDPRSDLDLPHTVLVDHLDLVFLRSNHQTFGNLIYTSPEGGETFFKRRLWVMVPSTIIHEHEDLQG